MEDRLHVLSLMIHNARTFQPNQPAAPNAGIALQLPVGHRWPGVGEQGRSATRT